MVKVKICGITNLNDALDAASVGADALGFVFYKKSPRYISPEKAAEIIKELPVSIKKVGVFVNSDEKTVRNIKKLCKLDILQFHGDETPSFCRKFKGSKVIKAFRIKDKSNLNRLAGYKVWGFLFDSFDKNSYGGTGKTFDWKILKDHKLKTQKIFLSGGLNSKNVTMAIKSLKPDWVDASSSLEVRSGKKDKSKVKEFILMAKSQES